MLKNFTYEFKRIHFDNSSNDIRFLYFASAPWRHLHSHLDWLQLNHLNDQLFTSEAIKATFRELMKIISVLRTHFWKFWIGCPQRKSKITWFKDTNSDFHTVSVMHLVFMNLVFMNFGNGGGWVNLFLQKGGVPHRQRMNF